MYAAGNLASEFDKKTNKMVNSSELESIMSEVRLVIPKELSGEQAAVAMRELSPEIRDSSIEESGSTVVDLRKDFLVRMSENGGALGLTKQLVAAVAAGDTTEAMRITMNMVDLVNHSEAQ